MPREFWKPVMDEEPTSIGIVWARPGNQRDGEAHAFQAANFEDKSVVVNNVSLCGKKFQASAVSKARAYGNPSSAVCEECKKKSTAFKVLARYKQADSEHNPDPITFKAFLSEFHQGLKSGEEKGLSMVGQTEGPGLHGEITVAEDKIAVAAKDLFELARRIEAMASGPGVEVNEHRLVPKMSGILSTLFYQLGFKRGLKQSV